MKTWTVNLKWRETRSESVVVTAETAEEAEDIAWDEIEIEGDNPDLIEASAEEGSDDREDDDRQMQFEESLDER